MLSANALHILNGKLIVRNTHTMKMFKPLLALIYQPQPIASVPKRYHDFILFLLVFNYCRLLLHPISKLKKNNKGIRWVY